MFSTKFTGGDRSMVSQKRFMQLTISVLIALPLITPQSVLAQGRRVRYIPPSNLDAPKVSVPGATRSACDAPSNCLIALLPNLKVQDAPLPQTLAERPTIYFLVPKTNGNAYFSLDEDNGTAIQRKRIYKTKFKISNDAGLIAFRLPDDAPKLELNKKYSWQFSVPIGYGSQSVYGSLQRVALDSKVTAKLATMSHPLDRAALLAAEGIWFEAVQTLAEAQVALPQNAEVLSEWQELLKAANLDRVLPFTFVSQIRETPPKNSPLPTNKLDAY